MIQSDLNWKSHVNSVCSKSSQSLGFINRTSGHAKVSLQLYRALCRPIFEYACPVWNQPSRYNVNRIEKIQRDFTRYCFKQSVINHNSADYLDYSQRLASLNLASLESIRKLLSLCFCSTFSIITLVLITPCSKLTIVEVSPPSEFLSLGVTL